jgi:multiple sugar transport system substrate-binding protein
MKWHRSAAILAGLTALVGSAAATGIGGGSAEASALNAPVRTKQVTNLSFWTFLPYGGNTPRGIALKQIVDGFNAANPEIHVSVRSINYALIDEQVIRATEAGVGPAIVNIYTPQLGEHVAANDILPLNNYAGTWLKAEGANYDFPKGELTFGGKLMALAWEGRVWLLWYNKALLRGAGQPLPTKSWTLSKLISVGAAVRKHYGDKITGLAIGLSTGGLGADFMEKFDPLLWSFGGSLLTPSGKANFASPAGVKAMEFIKSIVTEGAAGSELLNLDADTVLSGFEAGTIAMAIEGSYLVSTAETAAALSGGKMGTIEPPSEKPNVPLATAVDGQTLAIGRNTPNAGDSWKFIKYYLSPASQLAMAKAGEVPVLRSVTRSAAFGKLPDSSELRAWGDYMATSGRIMTYPANYNQLSNELVTAAQGIVYRNEPILATLKSVAAQYNSGG